MFDPELVRSVLLQIDEAIDRIQKRTAQVGRPYFFNSLFNSQLKVNVVGMGPGLTYGYFELSEPNNPTFETGRNNE